jgi:hypothetical protein
LGSLKRKGDLAELRVAADLVERAAGYQFPLARIAITT